MAFVIIYLPAAEQLRLFTFYDADDHYGSSSLFTGQKDIFDTYEEAMSIINDDRIIQFNNSTFSELASAYIDYKNFKGDSDLVPKHLLEVVEI